MNSKFNTVLGLCLFAVLLIFLVYIFNNQPFNLSIPLHILLVLCFLAVTFNTFKNHQFYFSMISLCGALSLIISMIKII